jgi:transcriptional regulator with PAS, ATPase and Fis domain
MDVRLQAKLLRVIQEGEVDRIGGRKPVPVDVRIIATTNRNLAECVKQGSFREDLFYRLNVVNLTMPPLRERLGDVSLLTEHFMRVYSAKNGKVVDTISPEAIGMLDQHNWPGNIRELENVVERAVLTAHDGLIARKDIYVERRASLSESAMELVNAPSENGQVALGWAPGKTLDDIERNVILEALQYHSGNRTHTAKALGISIRTLRNKLADYRRLGIRV